MKQYGETSRNGKRDNEYKAWWFNLAKGNNEIVCPLIASFITEHNSITLLYIQAEL